LAAIQSAQAAAAANGVAAHPDHQSGNVSLEIFIFCISCLARAKGYDHDFRRFSPIFGAKIAFFLKTNLIVQSLQKTAIF
jgi:hypothetical protein